MPRLIFPYFWIPLLVLLFFCGSLTGAILSVLGAMKGDQSLMTALLICLILSFANWRLIRWLVDRDRIDLVTAKEPLFQEYAVNISNQLSQAEQSYRQHLYRREKNGLFGWLRRLLERKNSRQIDSN
jgi:hypothetical protein